MRKIIHYFYDDIDIWKKGENSAFRMCYASWKIACPDYEIMCWHDKMPEFQQMLKDSKFLRECYKRKLWAFVADYVRHYALYNYGGIYLDTDVQLLKNFDEYIDKPFFCSIEGDILEGRNIPESAVMGGEKGHIIFKKSLDFYNSNEIFKMDYFIDPIVLAFHLKNISNFERISYNKDYIEKAKTYYNKSIKSNNIEDKEVYKNQVVFEDKKYGIYIYPSEYFCPAWEALKEDAFTENTVAIHWNQSSWWNKSTAIKEVEAFKFNCFIKRYLYVNSNKIAKALTFYIPLKGIRKNFREKLKNLLEK